MAWEFRRPSPGRPQAQASGNAPTPPPEAPKQITVPPGFRVTLSAAEPDVVQPIAMAIDHRGRLWVVENYAYPIWLGGPTGQDRILIFEDADGDGKFDRRTVFSDRGHQLHRHRAGLRRGLGLRHAQPDLHPRPRRRRPARRRTRSSSSTAGAPRPSTTCSTPCNWGPDGWLWGCNGILARPRRSASRERRKRSGRRSIAASGGITRHARSSRSSRMARPTRGGSTSTTTARRSSPTA